MDSEVIIPLIGTFITFVVSISTSVAILKKKNKLKLNRYFAGFFLFISFGFFAYFLYHILYDSKVLIYIFYYVARFSYSIGAYFLLHTTFLFLYSEKMDKKYEYISKAYLVSGLGSYLIFYPWIDEELLAEQVVKMFINRVFDLYVVVSILVILIFTLWAFASKLKNTTGMIKKKAMFFTIGIIFAIIAVFLIVFTISEGSIRSLFKIIGIFSMDIGILIIYAGISLKE